METIISMLASIFGGGVIIGAVIFIFRKFASVKNAKSLARTVAPVLDRLVVKAAGSEKDAEKLEKVYVPFLKEFMDELILQLSLDNDKARGAVKEAAGL